MCSVQLIPVFHSFFIISYLGTSLSLLTTYFPGFHGKGQDQLCVAIISFEAENCFQIISCGMKKTHHIYGLVKQIDFQLSLVPGRFCDDYLGKKKCFHY